MKNLDFKQQYRRSKIGTFSVWRLHSPVLTISLKNSNSTFSLHIIVHLHYCHSLLLAVDDGSAFKCLNTSLAVRRFTHQGLVRTGRLRSVSGHGALQPERQEMNGQFVGGHHDRSVRNLTDQLNGKAAVKSTAAFVAIDGHEARPEAPITWSFLSKTSASDLCRYWSCFTLKAAHSVTRFGEISPLWQNFASLWTIFNSLN